MALRAVLCVAFVIVQIENLSCLLCAAAAAMLAIELPMITFLAFIESRERSVASHN